MKNLRTVGLLSLLVVAPSLFAVKGERSTLSKLATGTTLGAIATMGGAVVHKSIIPSVMEFVKTAKYGIDSKRSYILNAIEYGLKATNVAATVATTNAASRDMDKQDSDETRVNVRRTSLVSAVATMAAIHLGKI